MKLGLLVMSFLFINVSFGSDSVSGKDLFLKEKIQKSVDSFFLLELIKAPEVQFHDHECDDQDSVGCMRTICSYLPSYKCDEASEMREVSMACRGLNGGSCIRDVCSRVSAHECDQLSELRTVIGICSNIHFKTTETICSYLSKRECDELSELREISQRFQYVTWENLRCLKYTCSQLPSYRCDDLGELQEMVDICQGE